MEKELVLGEFDRFLGWINDALCAGFKSSFELGRVSNIYEY